MRIQRLSVISFVAFLSLGVSPSTGSEFAERMASWQGGTSPIERPVPPATASPMPPSGGMSGRQRATTEIYSDPAPGHAAIDPGYNQYGGCQTCGQGAPAYMAGACSCGSCGGHGHAGWPGLFGNCHCGSCGDGCGDSCANGCNTLVWAKVDVLLWWRQGRDLPPLVTTDPTTEDPLTAGVLPEASILYGGERVGTNMQAGGRFDFGFWCDPRQCWGYGWRIFGIGKDSSEFNRNSFDTPVLAIPFTDADAGANDQLLVAFPGLRNGDVHVASSADLISNDVYGRFLVCRGCNGRLDFITGWNYTRLSDSVTIRTRSTVTEIGGTIPNGTVTHTFDQFDAHNTFNGAILGLMWEHDCGCWTTNWLARMSIGGIHQSMQIDGSTNIAIPNQPADTTAGGVFTAASNLGQFSQNEFTAITEAGFNLAYRWGHCTRINVGYTFMYWSDIQAPGTAIDTTVAASGRPAFAFRHSDYWVQGLNLGLVRDF